MNTLRQITIFILLLFYVSGVAQVVVERSENRIITSGVAYYIHIVKRGETAYSISRAYGITLEELRKENNLSELFIVNEGQSLRIPAGQVQQTEQTQMQTQTQVQPTEIKPKDEANATNEPQRVVTAPADAYIYHKVQRGESLSSIARQYKITVRELRRENSGVIFLQTGSILRIPGQKPEIVVENIDVEPLPPTDTPDEPIYIEIPSAPTNLVKLSGKINVAVLLPFYFRENSVENSGRRAEDWIYPQSIDFIEMYEGILFAADTLRSMGLDIDIYTYDIQRDTDALLRLIQSGRLQDMVLIIGPAYSNNLRIATEYARNFDIPVVSPVSLFDNSLLEGNPNLFLATPTLEVAQNALAKKIAEYRDHNFIFIHADSLGIDEDTRRFRNAIRQELSANVPFSEMRFLSRSMLGNNPNRFANALSGQTGNVVIIASEDAPVISETLMDVHALARRFDVKVFGYPMLREIDNIDQKYYFDLNMLLYSSYWIDYEKYNVKKFNADFRTKLFTQPDENSFAWQGYDIAYYFISGLALHGKNFVKYPSIHRPILLHTDFQFVSKNSGDGFENQRLFPIRYTKDFDIILEE
jgi:LysM repeat protein